MGWIARSEERRPWLRHRDFGPGWGASEVEGFPSNSASSRTEAGIEARHKRSPMRWSSQILSEK